LIVEQAESCIMAPDVNWDVISSVAKGGPKTDDEEFMEQAADMLKAVDESEYKEDSDKLLLLFQSAKKVMNVSSSAWFDSLAGVW